MELGQWISNKKTGEWSVESCSVEDTLKIAAEFAAHLHGGDVVALTGNLGSGKTVFVKGLAAGLGLENPDMVKSPTFVLMHIYPARLTVYHYDLYRLEQAKELSDIGFEDFSDDPSAVTCVEWAEKAASLIPKSAYTVRFATDGEFRRTLYFQKNT